MNIAMEITIFLGGNTFFMVVFPIVMLVFGGVEDEKPITSHDWWGG